MIFNKTIEQETDSLIDDQIPSVDCADSRDDEEGTFDMLEAKVRSGLAMSKLLWGSKRMLGAAAFLVSGEGVVSEVDRIKL